MFPVTTFYKGALSSWREGDINCSQNRDEDGFKPAVDGFNLYFFVFENFIYW